MRYWSISFLIILLFGCKGEFASQEVKHSYESVMEVHDEVMPEMSTINKLGRQLKKLDKKDEKVLGLIKDLEAADDGMMDWMSEFKLNKKASTSEQLAYLTKEQVKIDQVSADMKTAIANAQTFLNKTKQ